MNRNNIPSKYNYNKFRGNTTSTLKMNRNNIPSKYNEKKQKFIKTFKKALNLVKFEQKQL